MIHNLEVERRRIEEALDVLKRLHKIRKPSTARASQQDERDNTAELANSGGNGPVTD
jgi:hypothetical protein